ncbi:MAG TPA: fumarylacetoacetate hydrolase family protein [Candidatus Acidoferrales bacterium]|nr:fumarylacetoacetate hydrolase family protein [Candidatus Acidoferrales bacterium]
METVHLSRTGEDILVPKIFCLGKNYAKHAAEMKSDVPKIPIVFMKPSSAIVHDGAKIKIPLMTNDLHHETEIFFLIGREGKNIRKENARSFVSGMGIGLDLTLRDVQTKLRNDGSPWLISKGFDGSAPISNAAPVDGVDFNSLELTLSVNDRIRQQGSYRNTIFKIEEVVAFISQLFTLERGDLIFTGTPEGVAQLAAGDKLHAELVGHVSLDVEII